ncbi:MAG: DEAD/DEAH box helicase [Acidimicrobiia bacterium]|nr:DEAD/DEAH box helicase [Acidimicrobiia bacterium]
MALDRFSTPTRAWFEATFPSPTDAQEQGWEAISRGSNTLIHAPTGSGKTLAAFLWAIDRLAASPVPPTPERCRVLYVSPMKALAYDIERNLRAPLAGIHNMAEQIGIEPPRITTAMRTGDTPPQDRTAMLRNPPDVLITTPESLYLMLTSQARQMLASVEYVIVDEIHSIAGTKRGSHLALSLERLTALTENPPQRIGLSATQRPLSTIAEFLGGGDRTAQEGEWQPRPVTVVDAPWQKQLEVQIVVPVEDMIRPEETAPPAGDPDEPGRKSIWPAVYPRLLEMILRHTSTLLFVNSRSLAERLAAEINRLADEELVQSHHGSVSREQRVEIESRLKTGELRGVVATSTLELGIDMAAVDLVILVESPNSVARGLQRVGRAGHQVGAPSKARVFPKHRGDLLETAVVVERMYAGEIETTRVPQNPLDVLAQQVVAMTASGEIDVDEAFSLVRRALPFRDLTRTAYEGVLDMLAGRYPSDEFAELRPRIVWDRVENTISPRDNAKMLAVTNAGTIPDRGLYTVVLPEGGKIGELDEEMVYESRVGDTFVLGSSAWKIAEVTHDRVIVAPAPGEAAAKLPFWHGDGPGRPIELGKAIGAFVRDVGTRTETDAVATLETDYRLDTWAATNLARFIAEEKEVAGVLPSDRNVVVQRFRDEIGDWRTVVLTPYGARVHAPWALAARRRYREMHGVDADVVWSDDGIIIRFPDIDEPPPTEELIIAPDEIDELVLDEAGHSALFSARFREAAARALLLPRRRPGTRTPLWLQRRRASDLLDIARRFPSFPIVLETYREVLQDYFDLPALREVLADIDRRTIRVSEVDLTGPSPFATSLMFDFIASFMYEYDAPLAEKRAAALTLDRTLLRELLGDPQFRDLLDSEVIAEVELELQRLASDRRIGGADALHDALRQLGPLSTTDITARTPDGAPVAAWLETLQSSRRAVQVRVGGSEKWAAAEDLARLRDALGVQPPAGIPPTLLEPTTDPLGDVVGRYARTHGPFTAAQAATHLGLAEAVTVEVLHRLEKESRVASGAYQPGGQGTEWVDLEVLRRLRRRSLAVLRAEVEAVDAVRLGQFLPAWQGIGATQASQARLTEVVRSLQGRAVPASVLERDILVDRMTYNQADLDLLLASGEVVWVGSGSLGTGDGKVAIYFRDHVPLLHTITDDDRPGDELHDLVRSHLMERGASFFNDLYIASGGGDPQALLAALWDLVWSGEVTNDTLAPLRAFVGSRSKKRPSRRSIGSSVPPSGSGRWYLVADLLADEPGPAPEQKAKAMAEQLLERHGVVTRPAVLSEGIAGGFAGLYPVLAAMEDAGTVRRGYFVESLGGAQFGLPGAIDRLRANSETGVLVLAAADPANPYGATLVWPEHESGTPGRRAGAYVILVDGELAGFVERGGRSLLTWGDHDDAAVSGLIDIAHRGRGAITVGSVNGETTHASPLGPALLAAGFATGYKGLTYRRGR